MEAAELARLQAEIAALTAQGITAPTPSPTNYQPINPVLIDS
jgi:hypothetical protein